MARPSSNSLNKATTSANLRQATSPPTDNLARQGTASAARGNAEIAQEIAAVDTELAKLRVRFEQHFIGIDRKSPIADLEALGRRVRALKQAFLNNTALKFRVETLHQKFKTYEQLWLKTLKEIEEGTYRKDLTRIRLRNLRKGAAAAARPQDAAEQKQPAVNDSRPAGLSDAQIDRIYDAYILAKRRCNESTAGITRDALAKSLAARCAAHDVKVVIKDGKAMLKLVNRAGT